MKYTQANRRIAVSTPLGEEVLLLRSFTGTEAISQLFRFDLELLSENDSISFNDIVGKNITVRILLADGSESFWNGCVSRFAQGGRDHTFAVYRAQMVPWLWFLTRTADCRIFQNKKVPEIVRQIFEDLGFEDYSFRLSGNFGEREYCVQYRETDFNFISRLMEEEGIYYFFAHENGKHTLVLADSPDEYHPCPNQPRARYELTAGGWQDDDVVLGCTVQQEFRPGSWAHTDYNFETPSTDLAVQVQGKNKYEIYDYPGEYRKRADGDGLARIRLQEHTAPCLVLHGTSDCRAFTSGYKFDLTDHYRSDLNRSWLLTAIRHTATQGGDYGTSSLASGEAEYSYSNSFECIPADVPFRPPRITPQPFVQGCQTAVVVGPAGEEIYTDKYGRVKVQFHWDREGKRNENSSCWVRVSHPWAGKGWGAISIPRIGQEVIVDFLEGDPDQPIITGRVYNAEQRPPYGLPENMTQSGIKSRSSKGGGTETFNEIRLEDKKGNEEVYIHAEKDENIVVENDCNEFIGNDRHLNVKRDQKELVARNKDSHVQVNQRTLVDGDKHLHVKGNRFVLVSSDQHVHVTGNHTESVDGDMSQQVGGNRNETIGQVCSVEAGQEIHLKGMAKVIIESGTQISLMVGANFIDINPANIAIQGTMVLLNSGGAPGVGTPAAPTAPTDAEDAEDPAEGKP